MYYTDMDVVHRFENDFALYADNFADWAEQAQGNAQFAVWTSLAENGIGANLQHYNPLIDDEVKEAFGIPDSWNCVLKWTSVQLKLQLMKKNL
jgi:predicted oxidoreductase (fatty acid repression mutant protein)